MLHESGKPKATISKRVNRGYAIVAQIFALIKDLPLGNLRTEVGLALRLACLINGVLYNSEVWHNVKETDIEQFVTINKYLLRGLVQAHAKTPGEHLYLEMGALPITHVIRVRRLLYLQTILKRHNDELIKRVYSSQKENPVAGDWCEIVKDDLEKIQLDMSDTEIEEMSTYDSKKMIKRRVRQTVFNELEELKN